MDRLGYVKELAVEAGYDLAFWRTFLPKYVAVGFGGRYDFDQVLYRDGPAVVDLFADAVGFYDGRYLEWSDPEAPLVGCANLGRTLMLFEYGLDGPAIARKWHGLFRALSSSVHPRSVWEVDLIGCGHDGRLRWHEAGSGKVLKTSRPVRALRRRDHEAYDLLTAKNLRDHLEREERKSELLPDQMYKCLHCDLEFPGKDAFVSGNTNSHAADACPNYEKCGGWCLGGDIFTLGDEEE